MNTSRKPRAKLLRRLTDRYGLDGVLAQLGLVALEQLWESSKAGDDAAAHTFAEVAKLLERAAELLSE